MPMKLALGLLIAFLFGLIAAWFDLPAPSPPKLGGVALVAALTLGYMAGQWFRSKPAAAPTAEVSASAARRD